MGKDLKGKELGKGLGQRKDKYYYAKYSYHGKKVQQSFHTLVEAKSSTSAAIQSFAPQHHLI